MRYAKSEYKTKYSDFLDAEVGIFMTLGERIKAIRGNLSRDKFAPQTGIGKTALVNYETGERNPPSDYLVKILELYPDVSPAWLLMGEGEMKRGEAWINRSVPGIGERIGILRGDLSVRVFANMFSIDEAKLSRYENELEQPDLNFLADVCRNFKINPGWLLIGLSPKQIDNIVYKDEDIEVLLTIDEKILHDILLSMQIQFRKDIDAGSCDESIFFDLAGLTTLITFLYENSINKELSSADILRTTKLKRLVGLVTNPKIKN